MVTFIGYAFAVELPEVAERGVPELIIVIDNVGSPDDDPDSDVQGKSIPEYLEAATQTRTPLEVTYRPYLSSDLSGPQMNPPLHLTVHSAECTPFRITARAGFGDLMNRKYPGEEYTAERFPGLIT